MILGASRTIPGGLCRSGLTCMPVSQRSTQVNGMLSTGSYAMSGPLEFSAFYGTLDSRGTSPLKAIMWVSPSSPAGFRRAPGRPASCATHPPSARIFGLGQPPHLLLHVARELHRAPRHRLPS